MFIDQIVNNLTRIQFGIFGDFSKSEGFTGRSYDNLTTVHPVSFIMLMVTCIAIFACSRRGAIIAFFGMICFTGQAQRLVFFGVDFDFTRVLILVSFARILLRKEFLAFQVFILDWLILSWALSTITATTLLWLDPGPVQRVLGHLLNSVGAYLVFRIMVTTPDDAIAVIKGLAVIAIPTSLLFIVEMFTSRNLFSSFGGVPEFTIIREGKLRCQGAFPHPIVAGCFWAACVPTFVALVAGIGNSRVLGFFGTGCALVIVFASTSSTPVFGLLAVVIGLGFWWIRFLVTPSLIATLVAIPTLHMVMKAPVWHLISRISAVGGSTSDHRYQLIDQCIKRFDEWAFIGTKSTLHWGHFLFDVANYYVVQCVNGGLATFLLFMAILITAFSLVNRTLNCHGDDDIPPYLVWAAGTCLLVHSFCFIGLAYFGQITQLLFLHLAIIAGLFSWSSQDAIEDDEDGWEHATFSEEI
ncbi:MAG: hypothetical protein EWV85_18765 [Microcystis aeruginosa Ma_QC_C_20070703_M131]|uniref:O-antigen ligase domain-containing protein n=1 Tax=Microcystis aeruginosa Ma_QC_C_20070703_M131 TaxID=2486263 RepID=A0A551XCG9_MICAE|nr:MAG: hypothetical protein EWV85_18765 [Microcystis aeruginosa Ma_QC_C_20070703_M131]